MRKPKVSIIVPVYNRDEYLANTLDSLLGQTVHDIEIICVDDGSTDKSSEILAQYAKRDKRIKLISQRNGGSSMARNSGLKQAKADYIMFCDSDDAFDRTMCEEMVSAISLSDEISVAVCGIQIEYLAHQEVKRSDDLYYKVKFEGEQKISDTVIQKTDASVCNKIFRKSIIDQFKISFPAGLNNEDYYFYNAYMSVAKKAYFINKNLYHYIRHEDSIMSDNFTGSTYSPDHLLVAQKLFDFYKKNNFLPEHANLFWTQFSESFWFSHKHSSKDQRKKILELAKKFIKEHKNEAPPTSKKAKNGINNIANLNIFTKIVRKSKSIIRKVIR